MKFLNLLLIAVIAASVAASDADAAAKKTKAVQKTEQTREVKIAAVVNDAVITVSDVEARMKLYTLGVRQQPTQEQIIGLTKQTLEEMINETLEIGEATKYGIQVPEEQITQAFGDIAKRNNASVEKMTEDLKRSGVDATTLKNKIRAEIAWAQLVRTRFSSKINVSDDDINTTLKDMNDNSQAGYLLAQIDLLVPEKAKENEVKLRAEDLIKQIKGGARFSTIAVKFSQTPGAATGGDLGWLKENQVEPSILAAVRNMKAGEITPPVRTDKGWSIVLVREIKAAGAVAPAEDVKKDDPAARTQIANQLGTKRLMQMAQHYLNDLKAAAFIEKRI